MNPSARNLPRTCLMAVDKRRWCATTYLVTDMPYRFSRRARAGAEVGRVLLEQNRKATRLLSDWQSAPAARIHKTRQTCKRVRAVLRLLKSTHPYVYAVENRAYRDLSRELSGARDAAAMTEVTQFLLARCWEPRLHQSLRMLLVSLEQQQADAEARSHAQLPARVESALASLKDGAGRLQVVSLDALTFKDVRRSGRRTYQHAEKDFQHLRLHSQPELFHDWRKHVKYACYQTELLAAFRSGAARRIRWLSELGETLGLAQDLDLLNGLIAAQPDSLQVDTHLPRLRGLVIRERHRLHRQSLTIAGRLFGKPSSPKTLDLARGAAGDHAGEREQRRGSTAGAAS